MKILVRILKVEDGFTHYEEICRKSGKVMIQDYMESDRFKLTLESECGFELISNSPEGKITKVRLKDGGNVHRNTVMMCVDCQTEELADYVAMLFNDEGFDTPIFEQSDKFDEGQSIIIPVTSYNMPDFNMVYKRIKESVKV